MTYKMIRGPYHLERGVDMTHVFYDGTARIVNDTIEFKKAHWRDALLREGWIDYVEPNPQQDDAPAPSRGQSRRKKDADG